MSCDENDSLFSDSRLHLLIGLHMIFVIVIHVKFGLGDLLEVCSEVLLLPYEHFLDNVVYYPEEGNKTMSATCRIIRKIINSSHLLSFLIL